ncbi:hypothetical protein D5S18_23280 [Nocardia panacis]|uniref:WXG100 family type VII secretion target n=1 Tax=Nocardia panacis TaxID=2340916 RepID=A0A3A4K2I8_9NOCA|nr:hypothetical protein [Nocardia panacis]RJO72104.1 hypothetical protein D5S18_23280 [Nocardia panacis]
MGYNADKTHYNAATIEELHGALDAAFKALDHESAELKSHGQALAAAWEDNKSLQAYQASQANWDKDYAEAKQILSDFGVSVKDAFDEISNADQQISSWFEGA